MGDILKFRKLPPQKTPQARPAGERKLTWEPWAGFAALVAIVYLWQNFGTLFGG